MSHPKYFAIIPAAGSGSRVHATLPKQYLLLDEKPVLSHTLARLSEAKIFEKMILVLSSDDTRGALIANAYPEISTVIGGEHRVDSVRNGLRALENIASPEDWVWVHDAARPLLPLTDVTRLIEALKEEPVGAILGVPVRDTLKKCDTSGNILNTVNRDGLWCAQTPQAFRYHILKKALQSDNVVFTDEASAVEHLGLQVKMVQGSLVNLKITYPEDLLLANGYKRGV